MDRDAIEAALTAANEYLNSRNLVEAELILDKLIERAPREVRARELMSQVLIIKATQAQRRGDEEAAETARREAYEHYQAAVEVEPESAGLRHSAAMMALAAGETDAALDQFREAGRLDPTNPQHPLYEAQILIQEKRFEEAKRSLRRVIELDADEPLAHASLAMIALEEGDFEEALGRISRARRLVPDDLRFRVQEARIHRRHGDVRRALELLTALSDAQRADPGVTAELAAAYEQQGRHERAAEAWAHRYRQRPTDPRAYLAAVRAGEAFLRAGRRGAAELWLEQARVSGGNAPEIRALQRALAGE
ncbi:MAG: tetratricopeptide repeat protein [Planctomycetota bacterium]|nr:tetratricopeptide repeat protein [Planctomycetota bacterium]